MSNKKMYKVVCKITGKEPLDNKNNLPCLRHTDDFAKATLAANALSKSLGYRYIVVEA